MSVKVNQWFQAGDLMDGKQNLIAIVAISGPVSTALHNFRIGLDIEKASGLRSIRMGKAGIGAYIVCEHSGSSVLAEQFHFRTCVVRT